MTLPLQTQNLLSELKSEGFIRALEDQGAEIFLVGGIVRDGFLGIKSKDVDLLIRKMEISDIIKTISSFGKLTETTVADKMGIIKFAPKNTNLSKEFLEEDIDIALPRTETLMNPIQMEILGIKNIHNAFNVNSDKDISIEDDLQRRDFTINSIAIRLDGKIIDPFRGLEDLQKKSIRHTNEKAFSDDPLRMFRAVQFASRFDGFEIHSSTMKMIIENSEKSTLIAPERIHTELLKIFNKGNVRKGIRTLRDTNILTHFIDFRPSAAVETINTVGDFFFHLCRTGKKFQSMLNGDNETRKAIEAIHFANSIMSKSPVDFSTGKWDMGKIRLALFEAIQISQSVLDSGKLLGPLIQAQSEFKKGLFPKSLKEIEINGKDLIELGFTPGPELGKQLSTCLELILSEKISNNKSEILELCATEI